MVTAKKNPVKRKPTDISHSALECATWSAGQRQFDPLHRPQIWRQLLDLGIHAIRCYAWKQPIAGISWTTPDSVPTLAEVMAHFGTGGRMGFIAASLLLLVIDVDEGSVAPVIALLKKHKIPYLEVTTASGKTHIYVKCLWRPGITALKYAYKGASGELRHHRCNTIAYDEAGLLDFALAPGKPITGEALKILLGGTFSRRLHGPYPQPFNSLYKQNDTGASYGHLLAELLKAVTQPGKPTAIRLDYDNVKQCIAVDKVAETIPNYLRAWDSESREWKHGPAIRGVAYAWIKKYRRVYLHWGWRRPPSSARLRHPMERRGFTAEYDGESRHDTLLAECYYGHLKRQPVTQFMDKALSDGKPAHEVARVESDTRHAVSRRVREAEEAVIQEHGEACPVPKTYLAVLAGAVAYARSGYFYATLENLAATADVSVRTVDRALVYWKATGALLKTGYRVVAKGAMWGGWWRKKFQKRVKVYRFASDYAGLLPVTGTAQGVWRTNAVFHPDKKLARALMLVESAEKRQGKGKNLPRGPDDRLI